MPDVVMPRLSDSMEEGTILKWLKGDGDEVKRGEELVEIETDKATMTYEADQDGVLQIVASEGDTLPIGEVIARIGEGAATDGAAPERDREAPQEAEEDGERGQAEGGGEPAQAAGDQDGERAAPAAGDGRPKEPERPARAEPPRDAPAPQPPEADGRIKASPVARRMARDLGLELTALRGSGPGGRIVKADVEAAAREGGAPAEAPRREEKRARAAPARRGAAPAETGTAKGDVRVEELSRTQQVIARRMAESKATVPDFTLTVELDMEQAVDLRARLKELAGDGPVPTYNDMIVKACALALRDHPRANGAYRDGRFELFSRVNVGVAVAAENSLVVPTVFDADRKSLGEIARDTHELAEKVRAGSITPPELAGATFTVSNLGMYGIDSFTAVINPPQPAILAVGAVEPRAVVRDGEIVARHTMSATLSCDHRILYGADAAVFLGRIRELLEKPLGLAL